MVAPASSNKDRGAQAVLCTCLALVLILGVFYFPVLSGQADFYLSDISYYFHPFCTFIKESCLAGQSFLWNPYMYCGMSQMAVPSPGLLYPFTWLLVFLPFSCGLGLYLIFHQVLAGVGAFLLTGRLLGPPSANGGETSYEPALVAAAIFALSGYMFGLSSNFTLVASISWVPLAIALMSGVDHRFVLPNVARLVGVALCVAAIICAGRPEVGAPGLVLLCGCACWPVLEDRVLRKWNSKSAVDDCGVESAWRTVMLRLVPLAAGAGLSVPVVWTALEWARLSPRAQGMDMQFVFTWSANWYDFLGIVLNNPVGDLLDLPNKYRNMVASRINYLPFLGSAYTGAAAVTLACWGLFDKRWRGKWLLGVLFAGFCVLAAGRFTPVAPALVKLSSAFATFRYPVKLLIFPVLLIGLFAAAGTRALVEKRLPAPVIPSSVFVWGTLMISATIMIAFPDLATVVRPSTQAKLMREAQVLLGWSLLHASLIGTTLCAVSFGYLRGKIPRIPFASILMVLLVMPMILSAYQFSRHWAPAAEINTSTGVVHKGYFQFKSRLAEKLRTRLKGTSRYLSLYFDPLVVPTGYEGPKQWTKDERFYEHARQVLLPNTNVANLVPHVNGYEAAECKEYKDLFKEAFSVCSQNEKKVRVDDEEISRFCCLTSTSTAVTQAIGRSTDTSKPPPDVELLDKDFFALASEDRLDNYRIYDVRNYAPRCRFARQIRVLPNIDQVRAQLLRGPIDAATLPYVAVLAAEECTWLSAQLQNRLCNVPDLHLLPAKDKFVEGNEYSDLANASATIYGDSGGTISIRTHNSQPGLLLLSDQYYPGWTARIDGKEAKILRANIFSRAVEVPAGEHQVVFSFEPASLSAGLGIAGAVASCLLGLLLWAAIKERVQVKAADHTPETCM